MVIYIHKSCIYLKIYIAIRLRIQGSVLRCMTTNFSFLPDTYQLSLSLSHTYEKDKTLVDDIKYISH
jgi:hypothetical protein